MAIVSITEAARLVRKGRQTLYNHNEKGKISFTKTEEGKPGIDTSELQRVYGKLYISADKVNTVVEDKDTHSHTAGQPDLTNTNTTGVRKNNLSKHDSLDVETNSTLSWFIEQVDETKQALADTQAELAEREHTLAELRKTIALLPSPESVERRLAEQANRLKRQHNEIIEAERGRLVQELVRQQERATRQSEQWQRSIEDQKIEIEQARAAADELRQRELEQTATLKTERDRIMALESRGLIARLLNKKPLLAR